MSAIFGSVFPGTQNPFEEKLKGLTAELIHYGPDQQLTWQNESVFLGQNTFFNTPDSIKENLPTAPCKDMDLVLAADVRLDYRDELHGKLKPEYPLAAYTDAQLVVMAYRKWGAVGFCEHLIGEFAIALWDQEKKQLTLARDPLGIGILYYTKVGNALVFCTKSKSLRSFCSSLNYDEVFFIRAGLGIETDRTMFEEIKVLPSGSVLQFSGGEPQVYRYHRFYRTEWSGTIARQDAYELIKETFITAVRQRVRTAYPVAASLSGGLDSSIICYSLESCIKDRQDKLYTFSAFPNDEGEEQDIHYARKCARNNLWFDNAEVEVNAKENLDVFISLLQSLGEPLANYNSIIGSRLMDLAAKKGARSFFQGAGAEFGISNYGNEELNEMLFLGRYKSYKKALEKISGLSYHSRGAFWIDYSKFHFKRLFPHLAYYFSEKRGTQMLLKYAELVEDTFYQRFKASSVSGKDMVVNQYNWLCDLNTNTPIKNFVFETAPIEAQYPFLDQKLIELLIALPMDFRLQQFAPRQLARNSFRGLVPDFILDRKEKAYFKYQGQVIDGFIGELKAPNLFPSVIKDEVVYQDIKNWMNIIHITGGGEIG